LTFKVISHIKNL